MRDIAEVQSKLSLGEGGAGSAGSGFLAPGTGCSMVLDGLSTGEGVTPMARSWQVGRGGGRSWSWGLLALN